MTVYTKEDYVCALVTIRSTLLFGGCDADGPIINFAFWHQPTNMGISAQNSP
jgi:hypothetical protein